MISEEFAVVWDSLSEETKNQVVVSYLKSLSKWDFKRILCNVLDVEHYMDDEGQAMYMEMLSKMDANSIADHKAKIEEREYWRKLRGDIALEIIRKRGDNGHYKTPCHYALIAEMTEVLFDKLYYQDQEFFKDK